MNMKYCYLSNHVSYQSISTVLAMIIILRSVCNCFVDDEAEWMIVNGEYKSV